MLVRLTNGRVWLMQACQTQTTSRAANASKTD